MMDSMGFLKTRPMLSLSLLLAMLVAGCATAPPVAGGGNSASATFTDGQQLFLSEQYPLAAARFEQFMVLDPRSPYGGDAAYWAGRCYLKMGQYSRAQTSFAQALKRARTPAGGVRARAGLADAYFMQTDYKDASRYYKDVYESGNSGDVAADLLLYRLGQCAQRQGNASEAQKYFGQLRTKFPDSSYVDRPAIPLPTSSAGSPHDVQLGIFSTRAAADLEMRALRVKGVSAKVVELSSGGRTLYQIRSGQFSGLVDAESEARRLRGMGVEAVAK